jgi:hypothetical protein
MTANEWLGIAAAVLWIGYRVQVIRVTLRNRREESRELRRSAERAAGEPRV